MTSAAAGRRDRWWRRRTPSLLVFCALLAVMALAAMVLWGRTSALLPTVGKDLAGDDPWVDPVGIEQVGDLYIARIPDCALAPIVRIELWDESSEAFWSVSGPPTAMASFALGFTPEGFTEDVPYEEPPRGSIQRLVVVRSAKGVAGLRFTQADLTPDRLIAGNPIGRYIPETWLAASVCGKDGAEGTTTTTEAGG